MWAAQLGATTESSERQEGKELDAFGQSVVSVMSCPPLSTKYEARIYEAEL